MPAPVIVPAPSVLGLTPRGVQDLPTALLRHGLGQRLGADVARPVDVPAYVQRRDAVDGIRNKPQIAAFTRSLADAVGDVLDAGRFPVVLGGDCSILLGTLLALRRRGRHGLLFLDGHADFYQPEANVNGEAASSELAFATGRGPAELTRFDDHPALVTDEDVVAVGQRDAEEAASYGSQDLPPAMRRFDLGAVRRLGAAEAAVQAVTHISSQPRQGFWVHLDVDVLDDRVMPAVDYRMPDGLSWQELVDVLNTAFSSGSCRGLDVAIYNPRLDEDGRAGKTLVEHLAQALEALQAPPT